MEFIESFEIDGLNYSITQITENYFKITVPSLGSQRSANHVAPLVFATIDGDSIVLTGDKYFDNETEQAIKEAIMKILNDKAVK